MPKLIREKGREFLVVVVILGGGLFTVKTTYDHKIRRGRPEKEAEEVQALKTSLGKAQTEGGKTVEEPAQRLEEIQAAAGGGPRDLRRAVGRLPGTPPEASSLVGDWTEDGMELQIAGAWAALKVLDGSPGKQRNSGLSPLSGSKSTMEARNANWVALEDHLAKGVTRTR